MPIIDIFVLAFMAIVGFMGFSRGILRTTLSIIGLIVGASFALALLPIIRNEITNLGFLRNPLSGITVIVLGCSLGVFLFGIIGNFLRIVLLPLPFLKTLDSLIGFVLAILASSLVLISLVNAAAVIPNKRVNNFFVNSRIIPLVENLLPKKSIDYALRIKEIVTQSQLPENFQILIESRISAQEVPQNVDIPIDVSKAFDSIVRIDGIAESCSAALVGTGFVVGNEHVLTNAHVVAGVSDPVVTSSDSSQKLLGKVVAIDRKTDIAIIYVPGLSGEELTFIGPASPKQTAFVAGFPNGGSLKTGAASISSEFEAIGQDIDGTSEVTRDVIVFAGEVKPGNSGGPLLNEAGQVLGVIFAADATQESIGYALKPNEVVSFISKSNNLLNSIRTGDCARSR